MFNSSGKDIDHIFPVQPDQKKKKKGGHENEKYQTLILWAY